MKSIRSYPALIRAIGGLLLATLALTACNEVRIPGVYRIDVQQGNVITQAQLATLEPGMDKRKVRFILGTPLVTDAFNQQRWDYYYSLEQPGEERVQRIISVFFEGDRLRRVGGDVRAAAGPIKLPERVDKVVTVPEGYRDEGLFASLTPSFLSGKPKRQRRDAEDQAQTEIAAAAPTEAPEQPAVTSTATTTALAPASIDIDTQDERYLRDLLGDFGRETPAQDRTSNGNESAAAADEEEKEEGLLLRWAKRLGWGDSEEPSDAAAPSAAAPSPAQ